MINILVADDDARILRMITDFLKKENYNVLQAKDGVEALDIYYSKKVDLIILDIMMPRCDGWYVCKEIRKKSDLPILILTAKDSDMDELNGFDLGADEYISKPFNPNLLIARVKNLLKRVEKTENINSIVCENLELNLDNHIFKVNGNEIELTPKEYELLELFMQNKEITFERDRLLDLIWGIDYVGDPRTVDTHITRLRKKLADQGERIKTIRGFGYKFGGK